MFWKRLFGYLSNKKTLGLHVKHCVLNNAPPICVANCTTDWGWECAELCFFFENVEAFYKCFFLLYINRNSLWGGVGADVFWLLTCACLLDFFCFGSFWVFWFCFCLFSLFIVDFWWFFFLICRFLLVLFFKTVGYFGVATLHFPFFSFCFVFVGFLFICLVAISFYFIDFCWFCFVIVC